MLSFFITVLKTSGLQVTMLLVMVNVFPHSQFELVDQENDLIFISELFECYFSGPWIHGISRCDHSSVVHSTSILLSHYKGLNVEKFLLFFLLSVLTLYNGQVQSFPSILNTSFLFTLVFQAHDQAVTGLSLHATGNLILSTMLTLMLILSLNLYFYKSACTRSSVGTPARCSTDLSFPSKLCSVCL